MHSLLIMAPLLRAWLAATAALIPAPICHHFLPVLAVGLCTLLLSAFLLHRKFRIADTPDSHRRPPPGPPALPIVGHLHLLGANPHQSFYHMSKSYGPLLSLRLGSVPTIVASTPDVAMEILQTNDEILAARPQFLTIPRNCFGGLDIAFSSPGPYWRLMRQICITEFFSNKRLDYFHHIRTEELAGMMRSFIAAAGSPVQVLHALQVSNNNVISRMVLGQPMDALAKGGADSVVSIIVDMIAILGTFNPGDFIPWLAWTDLLGLVKRSKQIGRRVAAVFQELIDARRATREEGAPATDLLDLLLQAAVDTRHKELQLTDANIRAILMDMYAAGTDTSASTTEWALSELLANPTKLKKAQEELDKVVGRERVVRESDLSSLPYLRAVINESMRLHPAGPLLAPHYATKECQVGGYHVAANTMVYVNAWAIGRDPKAWENSLQFWPERFLGSNIDVLGQHYELIPFGSGRRKCPGWRLGLLNVEILLASLLHAFEWTTSAKPDMDEKFSVIMARKNPLIATPTPRLARVVYEEYM